MFIFQQLTHDDVLLTEASDQIVCVVLKGRNNVFLVVVFFSFVGVGCLFRHFVNNKRKWLLGRLKSKYNNSVKIVIAPLFRFYFHKTFLFFPFFKWYYILERSRNVGFISWHGKVCLRSCCESVSVGGRPWSDGEYFSLRGKWQTESFGTGNLPASVMVVRQTLIL